MWKSVRLKTEKFKVINLCAVFYVTEYSFVDQGPVL